MQVTGIDISPRSIHAARTMAEDENLDIKYINGNFSQPASECSGGTQGPKLLPSSYKCFLGEIIGNCPITANLSHESSYSPLPAADELLKGIIIT